MAPKFCCQARTKSSPCLKYCLEISMAQQQGGERGSRVCTFLVWKKTVFLQQSRVSSAQNGGLIHLVGEQATWGAGNKHIVKNKCRWDQNMRVRKERRNLDFISSRNFSLIVPTRLNAPINCSHDTFYQTHITFYCFCFSNCVISPSYSHALRTPSFPEAPSKDSGTCKCSMQIC